MSTPLAAYLEAEGISDADFAAKIKRDRTIVSKLRRGVIRASAEIALAIEEHTDGKIDAAALNDSVAAARKPARAA